MYFLILVKTYSYLIICLFAIGLAACNSKTFKPTPRVVIIQPLGDFPQEQTDLVLKELLKISSGSMVKSSIPFPEEAYYKPRDRYRADELIKFLNNLEIGILLLLD